MGFFKIINEYLYLFKGEYPKARAQATNLSASLSTIISAPSLLSSLPIPGCCSLVIDIIRDIGS